MWLLPLKRKCCWKITGISLKHPTTRSQAGAFMTLPRIVVFSLQLRWNRSLLHVSFTRIRFFLKLFFIGHSSLGPFRASLKDIFLLKYSRVPPLLPLESSLTLSTSHVHNRYHLLISQCLKNIHLYWISEAQVEVPLAPANVDCPNFTWQGKIINIHHISLIFCTQGVLLKFVK
jgi:hypothetical protein